jgi:hypothetical protein
MATPQNMHSNSIPSMPKGFTMVYSLSYCGLWYTVSPTVGIVFHIVYKRPIVFH